MKCWISAALLLLLAGAGEAKEPASVAALKGVLECRHAFHPQHVLRALQRDGVIAGRPLSQVDGIPVLAVRKPFRINGLTVEYVEGWDYEGSLFFFAAGTAPGTRIGIVVKADEAMAQAAFPEVERSGGRHSWFRYAAGAERKFPKHSSMAEVTCTQS